MLIAIRSSFLPSGLFLGTGGALAGGGPASLLLGYSTVGTVALAVTLTIGEMAAYLPIPGGHIKLADRFVDRSFSAVMGINYWSVNLFGLAAHVIVLTALPPSAICTHRYNWAVLFPTELTAASNLVGYWNTSINPAAWVAILYAAVLSINFLGSRAFGEVEFWLCWIKILLIVGLIILSFLMDVGAVGPRHGFEYWNNPGAFVQYRGIEPKAWGQFVGYLSVLIQAAFSFVSHSRSSYPLVIH